MQEIEGGRFRRTVLELEKSMILEALQKSNGKVRQAAKLLDLPYSTFCNKLKRLGMKGGVV